MAPPKTCLQLVILATVCAVLFAREIPKDFLTNCTHSAYGCCPYGNKEATGRRYPFEGCGKELCMDIRELDYCKDMRDNGLCDIAKAATSEQEFVLRGRLRNECYKTCGFGCKSRAPRLCESPHKSTLARKFGLVCCEDGSIVKKKQKCPPCKDEHPVVCRQFKDRCKTATGPRLRTFLKRYCRKSCNLCMHIHDL
ncbi:uncharacterized protein LOC116604086 [Nematostella vectensis]|uniref:uncharacterized protein LOC116604086 n=1 Tax=Nematostella vectensis TaxID=45351 RepID=UPI0013900717|nr:uncharacterized protein LOC116604086 [Nematostella vectensis]